MNFDLMAQTWYGLCKKTNKISEYLDIISKIIYKNLIINVLILTYVV